MYNAVREYLNLSEAEMSFLKTIEQQMGIVADLSRADILLYSRKSEREAIVLAHAQPHSLAHAYNKNRQGRVIGHQARLEVWQAILTGKDQQDERSTIAEGAPVARQALPIHYPPPYPTHKTSNGRIVSRVIGVIVIVTNLIEYERLRLRSRVFRRALKKFQTMLVYGQIHGAADLSPFGEQDGILFVDNAGIIQYASGIAANLYRRLGYRETLVGRHLSALDTDDEEIRRLALSKNRCVEREMEESDRVSIRKALPIISYSPIRWEWLRRFRIPVNEQRHGVIITLRDDTESRRQDQELQIKNAMIKEVHHRVKNNLQTIAGLLRMQSRRAKSEEVRNVLDETLNRILSIAVIHEFLSYESSNIINIKDVGHRIAAQLQEGIIDPDQKIQFEIVGKPVHLPARQATATSLILNELLQNAIEHGVEGKKAGIIRLDFEDNEDQVIIKVSDTGDGIPSDFKLEQTGSLGLQIVKILVEGDLKGKIDLNNDKQNGYGLTVKITFPKIYFGGEAGWKEHVSL